MQWQVIQRGFHQYVTSVYAPVSAAGAKPIAFGDLSYCWIADRCVRSLKHLNELFAMNGQVGFLANQRLDGKLIFLKLLRHSQSRKRDAMILR